MCPIMFMEIMLPRIGRLGGALVALDFDAGFAKNCIDWGVKTRNALKKERQCEIVCDVWRELNC